MANVLDTRLDDFGATYHSWVDNPDEWDNAIIQWHIDAKGRPPHIHEMRHAYWRVIKEGERWGTLRNALQDTWPKEDHPPPSEQPPPSRPVEPISIHGLIRVTDESDGQVLNRGYAYWPSAVFIGPDIYVFVGIAGNRPHFFRIKPDGSIDRLGPMLPYEGTGEGWFWDLEARIYVCDGPRYLRCSPFTGAVEVLYDISGSYPGHRLWQPHSSEDGRTHSATLERIVSEGSYPRVGTFVWRMGREHFFEALGVLDESLLTRSGRYLDILEKFGDSEDNRIHDLDNNWQEIRRLTDREGAVAHGDCGWDFIVGEDNFQGACVRWDLPGMQRTNLFSTWNMGHISIRGGRCLVSDSRDIRLVSLEGSGAQLEIIEHGMQLLDPNKPYEYAMHASLSPCGRAVSFVSNRAGRFDMYVLTL